MADVIASAAVQVARAPASITPRPVTLARRARRWLEELGWLVVFVIALPVAVLAIGSVIALVVNVAIAVFERF